MDVGFILKGFSFACVLTRIVYAGSNYNVTRENIALNKTTEQSSDTNYNGYLWKSAYAVDGSKNFSENCKCCSSAQQRSLPYNLWRLDLGSTYDIGKINIYGRPDTDMETGKFFVYAGISFPLDRIKTNDVVGSKYSEAAGLITITLGKKHARYIQLQNTLNFLTLCEVEVFAACEDNRFEPNCEECGHCDGSQCDKATGVCPSGCQAGWRGTACNEKCKNGTFGEFCEHQCHCEGETCDGESVICPSGKCLPGYQGAKCDQECDNGTFGRGCTDRCGFCVNGSVCNKVNGSCSGCSPGYEGAVCKTACPAGAFGDQCLSTCGHCLDGQSCDHMTGRCVHGCQPGFVRPLCNETCQNKTFGMGCKETCGKCFSNETCNITNGHCSIEGCMEDFIPPLCSTRKKDLSKRNGESLSLSTGALGGIVSAAVLVLLVVVVLAVLMKTRRKKKEKIYTQPNAEVTSTEIHVYDTIEAQAPDTTDYAPDTTDYANAPTVYTNV